MPLCDATRGTSTGNGYGGGGEAEAGCVVAPYGGGADLHFIAIGGIAPFIAGLANECCISCKSTPSNTKRHNATLQQYNSIIHMTPKYSPHISPKNPHNNQTNSLLTLNYCRFLSTEHNVSHPVCLRRSWSRDQVMIIHTIFPSAYVLNEHVPYNT